MSTRTGTDVDKITLTLVHRQLVNTCDEMAVSMMRTAYSPIFSEGLDFSTLILDREGNLVANAGLNPSMLGASLYAATWIVREVGAENFAEGDVYIHNDPYRGGSHMPEHMMVMPMFVDGELVAFIGNIAHMAEIGGMAPGSFAATATDVYQEGLRLPPVLFYKGGEPVRDIWRIMLANHRTPNDSWGDLHAMYGSLQVGRRRLEQLMEERGTDLVTRVFSGIQDYTEAALRENIRALPDGVYHGIEWFDDDGITATPYAIRLSLVVEGDEIIFDYSRSDPQAVGPINAPYVVTMSASLNALLYMIGTDLPVNAGLNRPVRIVTKPGTICCVQLPGACVGGQTEYQPRVMEMIMGQVLGPLLPERAAASSGNTSLNFLFGGIDPRSGDYYAHYHFEATGWGGRMGTDGNNATMPPHANCRNTPVEIFELRWPWIHESYRLARDEVGAGRLRGGAGVVRVLEVAAETISVSALSDRAHQEPWGLFGGSDGSRTRIDISPAGSDEFVSFQQHFGLVSPTKFTNVRLHRGDRVRLTSPSGAGYGPPSERVPELVAEDIREGYVSPEDAESVYKVRLDAAGDVDPAATARLREGTSA
ncbi:hydantoinase B/oxoprolinase family protein [Sphaerisporangium sp. NPDC049002]|uniref:hydantoinase B/oxoprolinase family protein n=1 Tax=unclassified Sphaerisporangium TaxID=2630420 RepID=UPI0033EC42A7